ncbi:AAA ATPase containing von Willebrand factor type A (vWA) domain [Candidatus Moduliflexus flocculans]|uniref:AAA ATPase containing von Willebrand factor type A (VWA) domain n=1 Tax=Candidatus Moduliflexus flocculans TaxID=1499966 RepID=A0A081BTC7_9BACT|nr:AAA ATPase containing von Willebrand factor type A (vWA) domain [Candidatus Moduliflexus flocculans]
MKENPGKKPFKKSDDDFDFEILNALEGHASSDDLLAGDENTIELSLDDDDLQFDDDAFEQSGEFSFDEGLSAGLEEELMKNGSDLGFEGSFEEEDEMEDESETPSGEDNSFSLDLGEASEGFSFDEEEMSLDLEKTSFESDAEEDERFEVHPDELDAGFSDLAESYGAETRVFTIPQQDNNAMSFDQEMTIGEELNISEEDNSESEIDISGIDIEQEEVDSEEQEIAIDEEFADLEKDIEQAGEDLFEDDDELQAKSVIAVGEDTVIDLGHEDDFGKAPTPPRVSSPIPSMRPAANVIQEDTIEESAEEDNVPVKSPEGIFLDLQEEDAEEEEFSAMQIDLNEEAAETPEPPSEAIAEPERPSAPDTFAEPEEMLPVEQDMEEHPPIVESPEPIMQEEFDVREFLGLTLRLRDEQMQEFEGMIGEAKTLQAYVEELESHQPEIKDAIYRKLFAEYNARKRVIFQDNAFTDLLTDVEQDLQDMLDQRQNFTATVARLNEELEEITVRHLVGEYTDQILAEKKEQQTTEIALWNEKTEKIQAIIERYQHAIDAERLLNPLRQETPPAPESAPAPVIAPEPPSMPTETPATEMPTTEETAQAASLIEQSTPSEEDDLTDVSLDDELLGGLSDLTQQAFAEETEEEESGDLFGGDDDSDEFGADLTGDEDFEGGDFLVDDLAGLEDLDEMESDDENVSFDYEVESEPEEEEEPAAAAMIACKKCGRQTPATQKFCIHCGGKAQ